jgi:hypothetical protein
MAGNVAFSLWLAGTSVVLWRLEPVRAAERVPLPA